MKYIQSFYQYPVTFSSIGKTIAARNAVGEMKNIVEISEKELEKLKNSEPFFRELLDKRKIRILDKVPNSYVPPAQQINKAQDEAAHAKADAEKLRQENEALKAKLAALEGDSVGANTEESSATETEKTEGAEDIKALSYEELKEKATALGIEYKANVKKADLIKMIEEASAKAE